MKKSLRKLFNIGELDWYKYAIRQRKYVTNTQWMKWRIYNWFYK